MTSTPDDRPRIPCVGGLVYDDAHRLLLVRRANPPAQGLWSIPGGRVEPGEDDRTAVARELAEETGLVVDVEGLVGMIERDAPSGGVYVVTDWRCRIVAGTAVAGDDASDVGWFTAADLATLPTSPGLVEALTSWDALPE